MYLLMSAIAQHTIVKVIFYCTLCHITEIKHKEISLFDTSAMLSGFIKIKGLTIDMLGRGCYDMVQQN